MLVYLPERLYENIKLDDVYNELSAKYTKEIFNKTDFLDVIRQFDVDNDDLQALFKHIREQLTDPALQLEYDVVMSEDVNSYQNRFDEMDVETKIYYLYAYDNGDMSWSEAAEKRNQLCIQLYEDNILDKDYDCSLFIHTIYYLRKVYELVFKYTNRKINLNEFEKFKADETTIFNKMLSVSDNESFKHIMYSKREQMYDLYLEFVGQFCSDINGIYDKVWEIVNNEDFKYNYFSYYKLTFFLIFFQQFMDKADLDNAYKCLEKLMELITYAYTNRYEAARSLSHYNKAFLDDFLVLSMFVYNMVKSYMPNLFISWGIEDLLKPAEYRLYNSLLTNDDKKIVKTFNVNDRFFSYAWLPSNKEIFNVFNKGLDK
jgi:hypothetical protein